jgi:hypothetical protein
MNNKVNSSNWSEEWISARSLIQLEFVEFCMHTSFFVFGQIEQIRSKILGHRNMLGLLS